METLEIIRFDSYKTSQNYCSLDLSFRKFKIGGENGNKKIATMIDERETVLKKQKFSLKNMLVQKYADFGDFLSCQFLLKSYNLCW